MYPRQHRRNLFGTIRYVCHNFAICAPLLCSGPDFCADCQGRQPRLEILERIPYVRKIQAPKCTKHFWFSVYFLCRPVQGANRIQNICLRRPCHALFPGKTGCREQANHIFSVKPILCRKISRPSLCPNKKAVSFLFLSHRLFFIEFPWFRSPFARFVRCTWNRPVFPF